MAWPEGLGLLLSGIALVVSTVSLRLSARARMAGRRSVVVRQAYDAFNSLSELRIAHWQAAHLLSLPENYQKEVDLVIVGAEDLPPAERSQSLALERAVATRIFELFEQSVHEMRLAKMSNDPEQVNFQKEVLHHFTRRLLPNPRLAFLWDSGSGALCGYFESYTHDVYNAHVIVDEVDVKGPFG